MHGSSNTSFVLKSISRTCVENEECKEGGNAVLSMVAGAIGQCHLHGDSSNLALVQAVKESAGVPHTGICLFPNVHAFYSSWLTISSASVKTVRSLLPWFGIME